MNNNYESNNVSMRARHELGHDVLDDARKNSNNMDNLSHSSKNILNLNNEQLSYEESAADHAKAVHKFGQAITSYRRAAATNNSNNNISEAA